MIYNSNDTSNMTSSNIKCSLQWTHLPDLGENGDTTLIFMCDLCNGICTASMVLYQLDNIRTNPYDLWKKAGKPVYPSYELLAVMRNNIV